MTKYVKYIDETMVVLPPRNKDGIFNYNLDTELLIEDGYKPLVEAEKPEGHDYKLRYTEEEDCIREAVILPTPEELEERERQRILRLKCTKRVFALILQNMGVSYTQLKELIASNERAQLEWDLCVELERSNPLLDVMAEQLGFDSKKVDDIFKLANGEDVELDEVQATTDSEDPEEPVEE